MLLVALPRIKFGPHAIHICSLAFTQSDAFRLQIKSVFCDVTTFRIGSERTLVSKQSLVISKDLHELVCTLTVELDLK